MRVSGKRRKEEEEEATQAGLKSEGWVSIVQERDMISEPGLKSRVAVPRQRRAWKV